MNSPETIPSPCIEVCRMNEQSGLCEGCWHSLAEIVQWANADDDEKRLILARIEQRVAQQFS